jgi:serine/threonine protein kinase
MDPIKFGKYVLLERLAFGGMAEVYLAFDTQAKAGNELIALKRILPHISEDHNHIAMFIDEGRLIGQLQHRNMPSIYDMGNHGTIYFQSLEFIFGVSLRRLWEVTWQHQKFPLSLSCLIIQQIASALDFAHKKRGKDGAPLGIIHRDVSPQNILISYEGDVKVIDFGIAKSENRISKTEQGIIKGKIAYMAPEQIQGKEVDHRIDIYALGLIFYELLTGQRAYKADSDFALLQQVRGAKLNRRSTELLILPPGVVNILEKAIHSNPEERYRWASDFAADLSELIDENDWSCNREALSSLTLKVFKDEYRAQKERIEAYRQHGRRGFTFNTTTPPEKMPPISESTVLHQDQLYSDEDINPETELHPIKVSLSAHTDSHDTHGHDQTLEQKVPSQEMHGLWPNESVPITDPLLHEDRNIETNPMQMYPQGIIGSPSSRGTIVTHMASALLALVIGLSLGHLIQPKTKMIAIATSPKGSSVFCNNKPVCAKTPCIFEHTCKSGKYVVQKKGYFFETVRVTDLETLEIQHLDLRPEL